VARAGEARDVADRRQEGGRGHGADARQRHQSPHLQRGERELGERPVDHADLAVEELDLAQAGPDHLPLVGRQLLLDEPAPPLDAEGVGRRGAAP
jgi:hypothetical protein